VKNIKNPHLIFYGSKTYPAIQIQSERIYKSLKEQQIPVKLQIIEGKKHVGMISQMIWRNNNLYKMIIEFLKETR
jgi:dipeptidyl aminopeptidase/acylaminoacyl peptidase